MPLRNGTGPNGNGPLTGRGLGNCNTNVQRSDREEFFNRDFGRGNGMGRGGGFGFGRGGGRGFGRGGGRGFGLGANRGNYYNTPEITPQQEVNVLKEEITSMQNDIDSAKKRVSELEAKKESE